VSLTELSRLVWIQRGVDAAVNDVRARRTGGNADLVAAECVACVDADAHDVPSHDDRGVEILEGLVDQAWIANGSGRRRGQHIEPARRDDADAERYVAGVD
jgi:hypothetical protein